MRVTRRGLQVALGWLWLLDGALQLQPFMLGPGFARQVLEPSAAGQPDPVHWLVLSAARLVLLHPAFFDVGFAVVQLSIGVGFLQRRTARAAAGASIVWAIGIWVFGEGMGGVLTGAGLPAGAPGAALVYALLAAAAWPARSNERAPTLAAWLPPAWSALWALLAASAFAAGSWGLGTGEILAALLAVLPGRARRLAAGLGAGLAVYAWVTAQHFGGLASGEATDPNTGPLLVLMAVGVAALGSRRIAATRLRLATVAHRAQPTGPQAGPEAGPGAGPEAGPEAEPEAAA